MRHVTVCRECLEDTGLHQLWSPPPWRVSVVGAGPEAKAHRTHRDSAHAASLAQPGQKLWAREGVFIKERVLGQPSALAHRV